MSRLAIPLSTLLAFALGCPGPASTTVGGNGGGTRPATSSKHGGGSGGAKSDGGSSQASSGGGSGSSASESSSGASEASLGASSGSGSSGVAASGPSDAGSSSSGGSSSAVACGLTLVDGGGGNQTNTIFNCSAVPYYEGDAGNCPGTWFGTEVIDFETCVPVCGASVQALSPEGIPIAGTAQYSQPPIGAFHYCLPTDTTFEATVTAPGYPTFYYGEIQGQVLTDLPSFGMLSTNELSTFADFLQPPLSLTEGAIVAFGVDLDGCGGLGGQAGWIVSLTPDDDGGVYPPGGYQVLYIDVTGFPNPALTSTSAYGVAILYNIDPSVATFPYLHAVPPDGGACHLINAELGFTGRVQTGAGIFAEQGLFVE